MFNLQEEFLLFQGWVMQQNGTELHRTLANIRIDTGSQLETN